MRPYAAYGLGRRPVATLIVISFGNETIQDEEFDPADALAEIFYNSDGTISSEGNLGSLVDATWKSGGGSGADFEIRVTPTSGTFSSGSSSTETWLPLSSARNWRVTRTTVGNKSCTATVEIRDATAPFAVRDTATITLTALVTV